VTALGAGVHILGDLITSFGTIVFAPLSYGRFGWGTTFIIDLWFSGIILAGLLDSLLWRGIVSAEITAWPRAVSPFNWTVCVSDAAAHRYAHVNLVRTEPRPPAHDFVGRMDAAFQPVPLARWETRPRNGSSREEQALARSACEAPALAFLRRFADKPALDGLSAGSTCVWFLDLRFVNPGRDRVPFRYGACRESESAPRRAYERAADGTREPLR
jgi:inner membrane protein